MSTFISIAVGYIVGWLAAEFINPKIVAAYRWVVAKVKAK